MQAGLGLCCSQTSEDSFLTQGQFVTEMDLTNGSDPAQNDYMMQSYQILIYLPTNTDSLYIVVNIS